MLRSWNGWPQGTDTANAPDICPVCGEPLKTKGIPCIPDGTPCECRCKREAEAKAKAEWDRALRVKALRVKSQIGKRYETADFSQAWMGHSADFDKALTRMKRYAEVADEVLRRGLGIYLYGPPGVGKTWLTACLGNALMAKYYPVLFTSVRNICLGLRESYRRGSTETESTVLDTAKTVDFLFLDDLGTEQVGRNDGETQAQDVAFDILNARIADCRPTIFSSNYGFADLANNGWEKRTIERIMAMTSGGQMHIQAKTRRIASPQMASLF